MYVNTETLHNGTSFVASLFEEFGMYQLITSYLENPPIPAGHAAELA